MSDQQDRARLAQRLRQNTVPAEKVLWKALRDRALGGFKFRRQHPVGPYFADFACVECRLIVEADGETHLATRAADEQRSHFLEAAGWCVLRFWNTQVYDELEAVKEAIHAECVRRAGVTGKKKVRRGRHPSGSNGSPAVPSPPAGNTVAPGKTVSAGGEGQG